MTALFFYYILLLCYNILKPDTLFHQYEPDDTLNDVAKLHHRVHHNDRQRGVAAQRKGYYNTDAPDKYAVKQKCYNGFSALLFRICSNVV